MIINLSSLCQALLMYSCAIIAPVACDGGYQRPHIMSDIMILLIHNIYVLGLEWEIELGASWYNDKVHPIYNYEICLISLRWPGDSSQTMILPSQQKLMKYLFLQHILKTDSSEWNFKNWWRIWRGDNPGWIQVEEEDFNCCNGPNMTHPMCFPIGKHHHCHHQHHRHQSASWLTPHGSPIHR